MGDNTAALVWGTPVHPVNLLVSIDAFRKATPILHSLRLCNQFGQGTDVHINKLSKELIDFIEEEVLTIHRREEERLELGWAQRHHCFQGTCRPGEHLCPPKIYDAIVKVAYQDLCEEHPEWYHLEDGLETPENLDELLAKRINENRDQYYFGSTYDFCSDSRSEWLADVRKHVDLKGGNAMVRKYFGLDIFIMQENLDRQTTCYLKDYEKLFSETYSELQQATICYLVIPTQTAQWNMRFNSLFGPNERFGESANSMLLDRNSLDPTEEHQQRFARAMRQLGLKPSVHPSQLQTALSAAPPITASSSLRQTTVHKVIMKKSDEEVEKKHAAINKRIRDLEQSQWPKLMLLFSQVCFEC
ncbi:hypothetical protein D6D06_07013 [Aureobasidium pullulans]|nr:hypothetical protein D6D06_07013 [Aureobasidium pullulans]THX74549.1 hypothetical protein D6D05_06911 [Aureobasidium pullulans]